MTLCTTVGVLHATEIFTRSDLLVIREPLLPRYPIVGPLPIVVFGAQPAQSLNRSFHHPPDLICSACWPPSPAQASRCKGRVPDSAGKGIDSLLQRFLVLQSPGVEIYSSRYCKASEYLEFFHLEDNAPEERCKAVQPITSQISNHRPLVSSRGRDTHL